MNSILAGYRYAIFAAFLNEFGDTLLSVTPPRLSKVYSYDAAGRTTGVTSGGITTNLSYDFESRLTSISRPGVTTNTFTYNGLDTRVGKVDSAGSTSFLRDGAYVTDPVIRDSNAVYTPGISERRGSATTFLHSGFKNADSQSSTAQTISATRDYDAYGNVISSTGTWSGPFGYAGGFGYQEDGDYGLKLLGHRYYDSSTGRFLNRDPAKDGKNWFGYCGDDPINLQDGSGLKPGDKYPSADAAAKAAIRESRKSDPDIEHGGWVYRNPDGSYSYIDNTYDNKDRGKAGMEITLNPEKQVPKEGKPIGSWHTHPTTPTIYIRGGKQGGNDEKDGFSYAEGKSDMAGIERWAAKPDNPVLGPHYLGGGDGVIYKGGRRGANGRPVEEAIGRW